MKKNKRAEIPITLLVLGVVAVCGLAILSFLFADSGDKEALEGVENLEKVVSLGEEIRFYQNFGIEPENVMEDIQKSGGAYIIDKEYVDSGGDVLFSVVWKIPE